MSPRTWAATLKLVTRYTDYVTLGGGEPTLHPRFWQILGESLAVFDTVWLATNGSQTRIALALANLAKRGVLGVALSQDGYHDKIAQAVIDAFTRDKPGRFAEGDDRREIRDVSGKEKHAGRCDWGSADCACDDICIEPGGRIRGCGCTDAPVFGTVFKPTIPEDFKWGECAVAQKEV